jgi:hypothetical protein
VEHAIGEDVAALGVGAELASSSATNAKSRSIGIDSAGAQEPARVLGAGSFLHL